MSEPTVKQTEKMSKNQKAEAAEQYIKQLLTSYDDLITGASTNTNTNPNTNTDTNTNTNTNTDTNKLQVQYQELEYDLIDKDLDYDEKHHQHLLKCLFKTLKNMGIALIRQKVIDHLEVTVVTQDTYSRSWNISRTQQGSIEVCKRLLVI